MIRLTALCGKPKIFRLCMNRIDQNDETPVGLILEPRSATPFSQRMPKIQFSILARRDPRAIAIALPLGIVIAMLLACQAPAFSSGTQSDGKASDRTNLEITVFAAASLTEAFNDLTESYEREYPEHSVRLNFDGSQRLRTQLEHGAQADVFASADWVQMNELAKGGMLTGKAVNFSSNQPAILVSNNFVKSIEVDQAIQGSSTYLYFHSIVELLGRSGVRIVAASHEVPAGRYSQAILDNLEASADYGPRLAHDFAANIVSRETNVRSVAQKVALGEADAGLTYRTDSRPLYVSQRVKVVTIPDSINVSVDYPVAALTDTEPATIFIEYLLSAKGQETLREHGFGPPDAAQVNDR